MTLKQEALLAAQLEICRALIYYEEQLQDAVAFGQVAPSDRPLYLTAMKRLVRAQLVCRRRIHFSRGTRQGYVITPDGQSWYLQQKECLEAQKKATIHK